MILHPNNHSFRVAIVIAHISCIQQRLRTEQRKSTQSYHIGSFVLGCNLLIRAFIMIEKD